jgi:hypothetical protein
VRVKRARRWGGVKRSLPGSRNPLRSVENPRRGWRQQRWYKPRRGGVYSGSRLARPVREHCAGEEREKEREREREREGEEEEVSVWRAARRRKVTWQGGVSWRDRESESEVS